jgi:hypothetical protein
MFECTALHYKVLELVPLLRGSLSAGLYVLVLYSGRLTLGLRTLLFLIVMRGFVFSQCSHNDCALHNVN